MVTVTIKSIAGRIQVPVSSTGAKLHLFGRPLLKVLFPEQTTTVPANALFFADGGAVVFPDGGFACQV